MGGKKRHGQGGGSEEWWRSEGSWENEEDRNGDIDNRDGHGAKKGTAKKKAAAKPSGTAKGKKSATKPDGKVEGKEKKSRKRKTDGEESEEDTVAIVKAYREIIPDIDFGYAPGVMKKMTAMGQMSRSMKNSKAKEYSKIDGVSSQHRWPGVGSPDIVLRP